MARASLRPRRQAAGLTAAVRIAFLVLVAMSLLAGISGGLLRYGVLVPGAADAAWLGRAGLSHAALMICTFLGTVIGLERAVAVKLPAAFGAPLASALGGVCILLGRQQAAAWLIVLAGLVFCWVNVVVVRRQSAPHTQLLLAAAGAWLAGNLLFALDQGSAAVLPWWFAFLVMTIAAERLEMTRLMRRRPAAPWLLLGILAAMTAGAAWSWLSPRPGGVLYGLSLLLLAWWLVTYDIARRTVFAQGLSRFMAVCLLTGYVWLGIAGFAWAATALGLPWRDAALHGLGLGFIFSMIMGHGPVILPAIAGVKLKFGWPFYLPLAALHLSLAVRLGGGALESALRPAGAAWNAASILLFAATIGGAAIAWRFKDGAPAPRSDPDMAQLMQMEEPSKEGAPQGFALWALGFRPFYLLASAFAALSILLWALQFTGWLGRPYLPAPIWHAHEMIFGFALAVVVGFLFTAGRNWSGLPTPTGWPLAALAALWVAGRVLVLTPYGWAAALVNAAFPLAAAIALAIPFIRSRNRRNYFFIGLLVLMSAVVLGIHLEQLEVVRFPGWAGIQVALDAILFIMAVMAGRVIPMFTNNGVPGAAATRKPMVEQAALGATLVLLAADVLQAGGWLLALLTIAAAAAHLVRWSLWDPLKTLRTPIVWVLQVAYFWIPVHLVLRSAAAMGWIAPSAATHALTVGAIGGLIIGMMTRTARGHTGRPLKADGYETACYAMVLLAAVLRVFVPLLAPVLLLQAVVWSAVLWSAAFGLYFVRYWPVLTRPRLDGGPG